MELGMRIQLLLLARTVPVRLLLLNPRLIRIIIHRILLMHRSQLHRLVRRIMVLLVTTIPDTGSTVTVLLEAVSTVMHLRRISMTTDIMVTRPIIIQSPRTRPILTMDTLLEATTTITHPIGIMAMRALMKKVKGTTGDIPTQSRPMTLGARRTLIQA